MVNVNPDIIKPPKKSIRNSILITFFVVLSVIGLIMNVIFIQVIHAKLSSAGLDNGLIANLSRQFSVIAAVSTIISVLIVLLVVLVLSNRIIRPIKEMTRGMIDVAQGKWSTRVNVESSDELGQLSDGFNGMIAHMHDAMQELSVSKAYNENISISVPSILVVLSNRQNILSVSSAFDKLKEQYPELTIEQFTGPLEEDMRINLKTGATLKKELDLVMKSSGITLIFAASISRIGEKGLNEDSETASILLTITNVTERRKMKELVLQSKQDWEDTFNTIPDMITVHDKDFNIIMANKAAKETLNLHSMDFSKTCKCFKYYHGTDTPPEGCPSCDCMKTAETAAFEVYEPYLKKFIEIRSIPRLNNKQELIGLIHIVRDISLRKEIENKHKDLLNTITKAKLEWEMTFDSAMEFIVLIDNNLEITRCNRSFAEYVRKSVDDVPGHHCYDLFHCPTSQVEDCKNRMNTSQDLLTKCELETESGHCLYISHRPINDEEGGHLQSVIVATDVTEIKNAQKQIKKSEKELKKKVEELENFYDMAIGREVKMKQLKKEVLKLNRRLN